MTTSLINPLKEIAINILISKKSYNPINLCIVNWLIDQQDGIEFFAPINKANEITMETLNDLQDLINGGYSSDYYSINNELTKARLINSDLSEAYISYLAKYLLGCLKWIKAAA